MSPALEDTTQQTQRPLARLVKRLNLVRDQARTAKTTSPETLAQLAVNISTLMDDISDISEDGPSVEDDGGEPRKTVSELSGVYLNSLESVGHFVEQGGKTFFVVKPSLVPDAWDSISLGDQIRKSWNKFAELVPEDQRPTITLKSVPVQSSP